MSEKKTVAEVEAMFRDINVPDSELVQFLVANPDHSHPFEPALRYDEDKVEILHADIPRTEGAVVSGFLNGVSRFRRKLAFAAAVSPASPTRNRKILVTEGDSWFQFPFLLEDIVDNLARHYNVFSVGKSGDTTENMTLKNPEFLEAIDDATDIAGRTPDGFVFSAGGNDFLGEVDDVPVFSIIMKRHAPGQKFDPDTSFVDEKLDERTTLVRRGFRALVKEIRREHPELPVFVHAYDLVFPFDDDQRAPIYAAKDEWIAGPLADMGITEADEQRKVTNHLLGLFKSILVDLAANHAGVHVLDTGFPLKDDVTLWNDEIHPTNEGFRLVANQFRSTIDSVLG